MSAIDVHHLTATEIAVAIRRKEMSAVEVVEGLVERTSARDSEIMAWETLDADGAHRQAETLDGELAAGRVRGPLHGVPVGIKDIIFTAGLATRAGSPLYQDFIPDHDATPVARLRRAGAIILGKTATTQFAMGDAPPTRNPWDHAHTPGGSSSGSAAAVADRMVPVALGTQTAGSVLRPSAYCGIVGLKPTYGRIGRGGVFPLGWSLDHVGIICRSVGDAAAALTVLAGPEPGDRTAAATPVADYHRAVVQPRPPRIGLVRQWFRERTEAEAWAEVEAAAQKFAADGAFVEEAVLPPGFEVAADAQRIIMASEAASYHAQHFARTPDAYRPRLRALIECGQLVPVPVYQHAQRVRRMIARSTLALFERFDVLLMSSAPGPAPLGLESTGDPVCNAPWSLCGFPSITLPVALSKSGLPLGAQLVAAPWQETVLLSAARWCEETVGFSARPPD
jgi:aspartyl-tRNA(Asn)/glutamyl-tRNA(Gln) amidotransferase subunit A